MTTLHLLWIVVLFLGLLRLAGWGILRWGWQRGKDAPILRGNKLPVSVVLAAREEYQNLQKNLPAILEQDYPEFEVIVVDDRSEDESPELLELFRKKHKHLKVVRVHETGGGFSGKKYALTLGIKAAQNPIILLTDADCAPAGPHWIKHMAARYTPGKEIVLGLGAYTKTGGFINSWVRWETVLTALQYVGAAMLRRPYMGVGRCLSYTRELFLRHKGFGRTKGVLTGDDDLFINRVATAGNTAVCVDPAAVTFSDTPRTWKDFLYQKRRHAGAGKYYRWYHQILLGAWGLLQTAWSVGFLALVATVLWCSLDPEPLRPFMAEFAGHAGLELALFWLLYNSCLFFLLLGPCSALSMKDVLVFLPLMDLLFGIYMLIFGLSGIFYKPFQWK